LLVRMGLHFTKGFMLWARYVAFLKECGEEYEGVVARCVGLPIAWDEEVKEKMLSEFPRVAKAKCERKTEVLIERRMGLEEKIEALGLEEDKGVLTQEALAAWMEYVAFEKDENPSCAIVVYERAILTGFLCPELWLSYAEYVYRHLKNYELAERILDRGTRNVPWSTQVWVLLLHTNERLADDAHKVTQNFQRGCQLLKQGQIHFSLLVEAYLGWARRQCKTGGGQRSNFSESVDIAVAEAEAPSLVWAETLVRAARIHAEVFGEIEEAQKLFEEHLLRRRGIESFWWIQYAKMLENLEQVDEARSALKRALFVANDDANLTALITAWGEIEGIHGSLEQLDALDVVASSRMEQLRTVTASRTQKELLTKKKRSHEVHDSPSKRQKNEETEMINELASMDVSKLSRRQRRIMKRMSGQESKVSEKAPSSSVQTPQMVSEDDHKSQDGDKDDDSTKDRRQSREQHLDQLTLFVSNLAFSVTRDELLALFKDKCEVRDLRLITRPDGASKGFAYVEFNSEDDLMKGLQLHQLDLKGRSLWVRRSKPPPKADRGRGRGRGRGFGRSHIQRPTSVSTSEEKGRMQVEVNVEPKGQDFFRSLIKKK